MLRIKICNEPIKDSCSCGSWLEHWEKHSKRPALFCSEEGCINTNLVGAFVQKTNDDKNRFLLPLCHTHNTSKEELEITSSTILIPLNKKNPCDERRLMSLFSFW
jgi:hypothetical protein